jgi:hypothetical protein
MQVLHCGFLFQIWLRNAKATGVRQAIGSNGNTNVCCQAGSCLVLLFGTSLPHVNAKHLLKPREGFAVAVVCNK